METEREDSGLRTPATCWQRALLAFVIANAGAFVAARLGSFPAGKGAGLGNSLGQLVFFGGLAVTAFLVCSAVISYPPVMRSRWRLILAAVIFLPVLFVVVHVAARLVRLYT